MAVIPILLEKNADSQEYVRSTDERLRHVVGARSITEWPSLFITGACKTVYEDEKQQVVILRMNLLFPPYHVLVGIAALVSAWLWGSITLGIIGTVFLLLGVLWLGAFQYYLFKKGLRKESTAYCKQLGMTELCTILSGEE